MIKKIPTLAAILLLTAAISAFFMAVLGRTNIIDTLRLRTEDGMIAIRASLSESSLYLDDLVVVGVDDESFRKMNRPWPWGRDVFAYFIERFKENKPKIVAFDIVFRGDGLDPRADAWWAAAMQEAGNVILGGYFGADQVPVLPNKSFMDASLATGLVDKPHEVDGRCRKTFATRFLFKNWEGYSLGTEMAYRFLDSNPADFVQSADRGVRYFNPGQKQVAGATSVFAPTNREGHLRLPFRYRPEKFRYVPIWRVVDGTVAPSFFENKIVLVGPVSALFHDIHQTPLGQMPGVFINANELMMILMKDFVREPLADYRVFAVILYGIIFTTIIFSLPFVFQLIMYVVCSVLMYGLTLLLFCKTGTLIEPFSPIVVMTINFTVVASWKALKTFLDNIALQRQVITDSLTGLYGHRFMTLKLGSVFLHSASTKSEFCVAMLDADHFKKVNDTYGHDVGNVVLVNISKVMKQHVRRQDVAARFGGEEFCVILIGTDTKGARECLERMRKSIEDLEFTSDKGPFKVTISSGICSNQNPAVKTSDDMLKLADKALYEAKQSGRNRVCTA